MSRPFIVEYVKGYTEDDIHDGDIDYAEAERFMHVFDDLDEAIEWAVDNISGEGSQCPIRQLEAADWSNYWISRNDQEFRHHWNMPGDRPGGTWYTDRSWHFDLCTPIERAAIFGAIANDVYGLVPYWR